MREELDDIREREGLLSGDPADGRHKDRLNFILRTFMKITLPLILVGTILILAFPSKNLERSAPKYFNGSHDFHSTVLLVSYDGFREDYLERMITPHIAEFIRKGIKAEFMMPSFPSVTFPNHYTIVTGLYPESHGIVGNEFYDPILEDNFIYTSPHQSIDSKWWGGEPLWVTAVKQGQKSGVSQWVGSSSVIKGYRPTYHFPYNSSLTIKDKVSQVMSWLDLPLDERPTFIATYARNVDLEGHRSGPYSVNLNNALTYVDNMTHGLLEGLAQRNLTDIVNVIIVSDHGMAQTIPSNIVKLDNSFDVSKIRPIEGFPLAGVRPYNDSDVLDIYLGLKDASYNQPWECFAREEIPERFHFRASLRIAPIFCIPPVGWVLTTNRDFDHHKIPRGTHGYDNLEPEMRGIFFASGPAFKNITREMKDNAVKGFINTEVYNIVAKILDLVPAENNGTTGGILWS
ncbi:12217_t:CDS:2 [Acaulospora morrowiae]|uniref:12217_t:CDS:1 n=1 Tax=Acaulospora morrowiae TaxID=94023 RepID=A0A9N9GJI6_9GLOM|nr:12217_t:CDS:2 [Acaulospora morrowiae]